MRPDEHKKKRHSAYKKKHGLQGSEQSQPESKSALDGNAKVTKSPVGNAQQQRSVEERTVEQAETSKVGGFGNKPVQSNWDRYQPMSDEDEDQGIDYNVLLSFAGDASSRSKFKFEEEWDGGDFEQLTIDHKHISNAMSSIPFAEKYNLKDLDIDPKILEFMMSIDECEMSSKTSINASTTSVLNSQASSLGFDFSKVGREGNRPNPNLTEAIESNKKAEKGNQSDPNLTEAIESNKKTEKGNESNPNLMEAIESNERVENNQGDILKPGNPSSQRIQSSLPADKSMMEDVEEIDELLFPSSKNPVLNSNAGEPPPASQEQGEESKRQHKETDTELKNPTEKQNGEVDDLEDWLDSIL